MMTIVKVSEFRKQISRYLTENKGSIVLVRHGSPIAIVTKPQKKTALKAR